MTVSVKSAGIKLTMKMHSNVLVRPQLVLAGSDVSRTSRRSRVTFFLTKLVLLTVNRNMIG